MTSEVKMEIDSYAVLVDYNKLGTVEFRSLLRWGKYEQEYRGDSDNWSPSYIPLLSFESLQALKQGLARNVFVYHQETIIDEEWKFGTLDAIMEGIRKNSLFAEPLANLVRKALFVLMMNPAQPEKKNYCCTSNYKDCENLKNMKNVFIIAPKTDIVEYTIHVRFIHKTAIMRTFWMFTSDYETSINMAKTLGRLGLTTCKVEGRMVKAPTKSELIRSINESIVTMNRLCCKEDTETFRVNPQNVYSVKSTNEEHSKTRKFKFRPFRGLIDDVRRRQKHYISDFTSGLHYQIFTSFVFMYFACLSPLITFGGLLSQVTEGHLGTIESLLGGSICGIVYALFSGQPLTILGSTGPILVFESILYRLCITYGLTYLSFRFWVGCWIAVILLIIVTTDASRVVHFITRFTEDIFAALISFIYIVEAIRGLAHILHDFPIHKPYQNFSGCNLSFHDDQMHPPIPNELSNDGIETTDCIDTSNIFFLSLLLTLGMYWLTSFIKRVDSLRLFPQLMREFLSHCAIILAIVALTAADYFSGVNTHKLQVPDHFQPTLGASSQSRGWLVAPFLDPGWSWILALMPALLAVILIFLDQQITAVIINKDPDLKKGPGYHLDLLIVAVLVLINSIIGAPWFVAATVLSMNHVASLRTGDPHMPCREQRVTALLVGATIGVSVLLTPILKLIPMPILYGVFLIMGSSSLGKIQFIKRLKLIFIPVPNHPDYDFLGHVKLSRVHFYTGIQIVSFAILWVVKSIKTISLGFPLTVLAMCFVRKLLERLFTRKELFWLDELYPNDISEDEKLHDVPMTDPGQITIDVKEVKKMVAVKDKIYQDNIGFESEKSSVD